MDIQTEQLAKRLESVTQRLEKIENIKDQEIVTLVEILANANFFGQMKKALCQYAKDGQCSLFIIDAKSKAKIPFTTSCRIRDCKDPSNHCHIDLSSITCGLCNEAETSTNSLGAVAKANDQYPKKQTIKE